MKTYALVRLISIFLLFFTEIYAENGAELAKKLANPIANLISLPIQANYDENYGPNEEGSVWRTNVQPVIPVSINPEWNVISRTIVPLLDQKNVPVQGINESGVGDIVQSFFFSPKAPTSDGWLWGVGPVFMFDSASDDTLGSGKWGAGPTAVALKQDSGWTYGMLANHIESFAGDNDRSHVSATFVQPFLAYIFDATKTTLSMNSESTYDWSDRQWSTSINAGVYQMLKLGAQIMQVGVGGRYWVEAPEYGPDGWGLRVQLTFLFIK